jgi:hypothetical protein
MAEVGMGGLPWVFLEENTKKGHRGRVVIYGGVKNISCIIEEIDNVIQV